MDVPLSAVKKQDILSRYKLPAKVLFCKRCTMSNQRPRIQFDEAGICSACRYAEYKRKADWNEREKELVDLCDRYRKSDGSYDVLVPCSGGKDGGYVAHQLKFKYRMNPLTVTWSPNIYTEIGWTNLRNFIDSGFDNILGTPNGLVNRILMRLAFVYQGDPFQPFIYGVTNFPLRIAVQHGISLLMYGENGEVEYGGDMKNVDRPTRDITDHSQHYFSDMPPEVWLERGLTEKDLYPYLPPDPQKIHDNKTEIHFMGYYKFWDPQENFYYCIDNTNFSPNPERNEGTYSKYASIDDQLDGFHYWMGWIKFGIGRATSDSAHEIRDGKIDRDEGIGLVKRFDGEFPKKYFKQFLDHTSIDETYFWDVVESWRSDHIWRKSGNDWVLKHPIWTENEGS